MVSKAQGEIRVPVWSDGGVVKPIINDDGQLEVIQEEPSDMQTAIHGLVYGNLQQINLVWGYYDCLEEQVENTSTPSGNVTLSGSLCPAGYVWRIENISFVDSGTDVTRILISVVLDGVTIQIHREAPGVSGVVVSLGRIITLKQGARLKARFIGCGAGDHIRLTYIGYRMKVNE